MTNSRGFTLIEMAIVLVIITILIGGLAVPLSAQIQARRISETQKTLGEAQRRSLATLSRIPAPSIASIASATFNITPVARSVVTTTAAKLWHLDGQALPSVTSCLAQISITTASRIAREKVVRSRREIFHGSRWAPHLRMHGATGFSTASRTVSPIAHWGSKMVTQEQSRFATALPVDVQVAISPPTCRSSYCPMAPTGAAPPAYTARHSPHRSASTNRRTR